MQALFVHGMGRTPLSGFRMLRHLRKQGIKTSTFFYSVTFEDFASVEQRLRTRIADLADQDDYILIGHSLGGIFIRSALSALPEGTRPPTHVFVMGSPVRPARIAKYLGRNWLFKLATRDCGQLLGSDERMAGIPAFSVPCTSFVGTRGFHGRLSFFGDEVNDGVVSESEIAAPWITEEIRVPVVHSLMASSKRIARLIVDRIHEITQSKVETT